MTHKRDFAKLPSGEDLTFRESGRLYTRPLLERLKEFNITAIDLTENFSTYLKKRRYEELKVKKNAGHPHYNAEDNRLVADILHRFFLEESLVIPLASPDLTGSARGL